MDNVTAAGLGAVAGQGPTLPPAHTGATRAASPLAGPVPPAPSSAVTAAVSPPTMILPQVHTRRARHTLSHIAPDRWLRRLVVVAGVTFAVSLATAATMLLTGGSADRPAAPPAAASSATAVATPETATEPLPSLTTSEPRPSPTAVQRPRQRPADLIAGIQAGLDQLVRNGHLEEDSAEDLDSQLEDVSDALADGEIDKAWDKLRDAAEDLHELREDGDLTTTGYQTLATAFTQLAQAFPPR